MTDEAARVTYRVATRMIRNGSSAGNRPVHARNLPPSRAGHDQDDYLAVRGQVPHVAAGWSGRGATTARLGSSSRRAGRPGAERNAVSSASRTACTPAVASSRATVHEAAMPPGGALGRRSGTGDKLKGLRWGWSLRGGTTIGARCCSCGRSASTSYRRRHRRDLPPVSALQTAAAERACLRGARRRLAWEVPGLAGCASRRALLSTPELLASSRTHTRSRLSTSRTSSR
jgi:hypothetical protein